VATTSSPSRLIGRDAELALLRSALAEAAAGRPSLAFVAGESGVGKTRLLDELALIAREDGARVLTGECVDLGEGELPYAPLVAALRPLVRSGDPALLDLPAAVRGELAALLPGLDGGAGAPDGDGRRGTGDAQPRLFEALLAALDRLGRDAPLVLNVEDVHWADRSTRDFLAFLGRNLADERVLVTLSYRPDELHRRHPLRSLLAVLERAPSARRIELGGLARDDVAALARDVLGSEPSGELVDRLLQRSDGNALFVEELLAAGPGPLAPSLSDALMVRIERLPAAAQEVVRVLAVAQPADEAVLEALTGLDQAALRTALRDAIAGHVVAVDDERYAFRHVLLREVVYDDLLPGERSALHLAVGRALEARLGDRDRPRLAGAIAHHFHVAGDQPAALRSAIRAAAAAERVHAAADAAAMFERALELWDRVEDPERLAGIDHVDLLRRAGWAHRMSDDPRRVTLIGEAIRELRAVAPDDPRVPGLLRDRAMAEWSLGRGEASRATLDLARRLLADDAPAAERRALTISRIKLAMLQSRFTESIALTEEVLPELEGRPEADAQRAEAYTTLGHALIMTGEHARGREVSRQAVALAGDNADMAGIAYVNFADALQLRGDGREAAAVVAEGLREVDAESHTCTWLHTLAAELAIDRGDWAAAREGLGAVGRTSGGTRVGIELRRGELALALGDLDAARASCEEAELLLVDSLEPQFVAVAGVLRAELDRRDGRIGCARDAIEAALERVEYCSDDTVRLGRLAVTGLAIEADAAQRARDLGDAEDEAAAIARAEVMLSRARAAAASGGPLESALHLTAEGHHHRATGAAPGDAWPAAANAWAALDRPLSAAIARWRGAEACLAHGDRDGAAGALRDALGAARRLGCGWLVEEFEGLAARARLTIDAPADGDAAAPEADVVDGDPFGLTPRERQVLGLVARGATNREIGAELYMAEKTASVHVSRILAKLDVRSRTEAAAVAHRLGMAEAPRDQLA
jgi:DNA-binding CsgD family transcriptional regulator